MAKTVGLIDPSLEQGGAWDVNLGDLIIAQSVRHVIEERCGLRIVARVPSLRALERRQFDLLRGCDYVILGGTNLLSSHMRTYRQWMIGLRDILRLTKVVLLGVGWWQYQSAPDLYTRLVLKRVLHGRLLHSVRDAYTKTQLAAAGIRNVLNTSCPTLWEITSDVQKAIPATHADDVITTVTCYNKNPQEDLALLAFLARCYANVYIWPQGDGDAAYIQQLGQPVKLLQGTLEEYDRFLDEHRIDYVGKRLHAGIRAVQKRKRTLVLRVDNRATELGRDTHLATLPPGDLAAIDAWIQSETHTDIRLPTADIEKWIEQFR
jgi:polysaccharide pyruvyl transferase WcaK-like protein